MSEQAPQQHDSYNPIQDRLAAFDALKEEVDTARAAEAYYDSLIGDAGTKTGDLSPAGKQRLQDAAVYDAHQQDLTSRTDEFDTPQAAAGDQAEISNDEYKAAYEALADKFATDPQWRRADMMSKRIDRLSKEADTLRDQGETEKARAASTSRDVTEHALTDLLAQYAKEPGFNQAVADYLLDRDDVAALDRAAFSALAELAAPTSSEVDSTSDNEQDDADAAAKLADLAARHNPPETDTNDHEPSDNNDEEQDDAAAAKLAERAQAHAAPSPAGDTAPAAPVTPDTAPQPMTREDRERRINASPLARQIALELAHAAAVPVGIDPERGGNNRERQAHLKRANELLFAYKYGDDNGKLSEQPDSELVAYFAQQLYGDTTVSAEPAQPNRTDTTTPPTSAGPAGGTGEPSVMNKVRAINAGGETLYLGSDDADAAAKLADLAARHNPPETDTNDHGPSNGDEQDDAAAAAKLAELARNHPLRKERVTNTLKTARERASDTGNSLAAKAVSHWHSFFSKGDKFVDYRENERLSRRQRLVGSGALVLGGLAGLGIIFPPR